MLSTPLLRALRVLAAFGVFRVTAAGGVGIFAGHPPMSLPLRFRPAALALTTPGSWGAWNELDAALTGEVPYRCARNTGRFGHLREHPTKAVTSTCS